MSSSKQRRLYLWHALCLNVSMSLHLNSGDSIMWALHREKKRQEMELMGVRADALQAENQRLRLLLAQRDQETMRLRREVGRLREVGNPPQLPPPQLGAPLPDLAAMAAAGFAGAGRAAIPPSAAAYNFPEGASCAHPTTSFADKEALRRCGKTLWGAIKSFLHICNAVANIIQMTTYQQLAATQQARS